MATVAEFLVRIGANVRQFESGMQSVSAKLDAFKKKSADVEGAAGALAGGIGLVGGAMLAGAGYAMKAAGNMEQTQVAFTTLTGSAEKADAVIRDMMGFAAKTPFESQSLLKGTQGLIAFGMETGKATSAVKTMADAVAAAGGGGPELEGLSTALGQIQAKGKVSSEELMQMAERGVPAFTILAEQMGMTGQELSDALQKGAIDADTGITALLAGLDKKYKGAAEAQSQTFNGQMSNLKDNVDMLAVGIGKSLIDAFNLKDALKGINSFMSKLSELITKTGSVREAFQQMFPPWAIAIIVTVAGLIGGVFVAALVAMAIAAWAAVAPFLALYAPILLIVAAVIAVALAVFFYWNKIVEFFTVTIPAAVQVVVDWFKALPENIMNFLSTLPERLLYLFFFLLARLSKIVYDGTNAVIKFFMELPGKILAFITNLKQKGIDLFVKFVKGIHETVTGLPKFFTDLWDKIIQFIEDLPSILKKKATSMGDAIWQGIKDGLGIHSPGYVERAFMAMEDQARTTMSNMSKLAPRFASSMQFMATPAIDMTGTGGGTPITALTSGLSGGGVTVNLNGDVNVRDDSDIERIAQRLYRLQQTRSRGQRGVNI